MKFTYKDLLKYFEYLKNLAQTISYTPKRSFIKTDKQISFILGIVFTISVVVLLSYWLLKEKPYYNKLITEKDELINTLKFIRDKQKKIYENSVAAYEEKLTNEYILKSIYNDKVNDYENKLNSYKNNYISREEHKNLIKELEQQMKEEPSVKGGISTEEFEKKITTLEQRASILEDKNFNLKTTLEKSLVFIKEEKEILENMLLLERKKAFIPSLILPETKNNSLTADVLKRLITLRDKLKNIEEMNLELKPDTYFEMGLVSYYNKQYEEAIEEWENAISLNKNNLKAYICLGIAYNEKGMSDNAIMILKHAIEVNPKYATLHLSLARIYEQKGALDNAIYEYSKVLEVDPTTIDIHNVIGTLYEKKGLKEEAKKSFAQYERLKKASK